MIKIKQKLLQSWQNKIKDQLSMAQTSLTLCLLSIFFAILSSAVIILLRLLLTWVEKFTHTNSIDLQNIISDWRVLLPIFGAILIRLSIYLGSKRYKRMGIAYVIHRFNLHYGKLPFASLPAQFFQALFALAGNFSVGKEGPAIHLGAATASVMAQKFNLPDNSIRVLCASGIAAGIAAVFNSPFAAVIFVFEVIIREYRIHYFVPVMLSATCGAIFSQLFFGNVHEFDAIQAIHLPLAHYPILLVVAIILGICAALFNSSLIKVTCLVREIPLTQKLLLAGLITMIIGLFYPQALGTGDKAIEFVISENPGITLLIYLLFAKVIATITAIGLGIPGGLIGPLYGIGALIGTILALILVEFNPAVLPYIGIYTVVGMTAIMGVCLSAPLAALVALLELTNNAVIILPAMFVTTIAFYIAYKVCHSESIFLRQLDMMDLNYHVPMINKSLQTLGVRTLMGKDLLGFTKANYQVDSPQINSIIPIPSLPDTASLNAVYELLHPTQCGYVYIYHQHPKKIVGIISWESLEHEIHRGKL